VISMRLAGGIAGLALAAAVAVGPVLAATRPAANLAAGTAGSACADARTALRTAPSLSSLKAFGDCEIDRRLATIARLRTAIGDAKALTSDHRAALRAILDSSEAGLSALKPKIDADTDLAALKADVHSIFDDYRIYVLVVRQVHLVGGDDRVAAAAARLTGVADKLQAAITTAQGQGKDVTGASAHLAAMRAAIAAALGQVDGDAAAVLPLLPADWNAGTAKPILDAAHASLDAARADLATALAEAKAAKAALQ